MYITFLPSGEKCGRRESDLSRVIARTFLNTMSDVQISEILPPSREYENTIFPAKKPGLPSVRCTAASHAFINAAVRFSPEHTCSNDVPPRIATLTAFEPACENENVNCALAGVEIM